MIPGPGTESWIAAVHRTEHDHEPLGAAVVIDSRRALTAAHVVARHGVDATPVWLAFPKAESGRPVRRRASITLPGGPQTTDLALLSMDEDAPAGVRPAPLRLPRPADLVGRSWWAFGFPGGDPLGDVTSGKVDASLGYGWIRLATSAPYPLAQGYSGAGLWSPDYEAVVGVVGQAHSDGGGRAISLHQADLCFPEEKLRSLVENWSAEQAGRLALASWGWSLDTDPEGVRHWRPRARGVTVDSERGYRFRGRTAALTTIVNWLGRARPDRRALVVTGSPGVGKSAVLGRIVTTADAGIRDELPEDDEAVRAPVGSVACAVHAKGKTALDVAREIARAASAALPEDVDDLERALQAVLPERSRRFNVVIDALDEVTSPTEARTIITHVVLPIVETCAELGAQVVIATRRRDDGGDLLGVFSGAASIVDLDEPAYFAREDLVEYAMATLRLVGDERPDNPYQPEQVARPVAEAIAARSERNFLIAGLVARTHGMHDQRPVEAASLSFTATVEEALRNYVSRLPNVDALPASSVLTALAFAESPGFDLDLWRLAILALDGASTTTGQLARFARSSAANFLVESTFGEHGGVYRLFHQALNDALRAARSPVRPRAQDEGALARAFLSHAHKITWEHAPPYLLRSLAGHAARGGVLEELLTDAEYLLHADLHHLASYAIRASSPYVRARGRLIQLTPSAQEAPPHVRAALFSVTSAVARLDVEIPDPGRPAPYRAAWATVMPRADEAVLEGHTGTVNDVCAFTLGGRTLLASAGADRAVRIWNPADGQAERVMTGHTAGVTKVRAFALDGRLLLATASEDGTIRIWDPATGLAERTLAGHTGPVTDVCAFTVEGRTLLASTGGDGSVRVWDPALGRVERHLSGHRGGATAVCVLAKDLRTVVATTGEDGAVRIWDPGRRRRPTVLMRDAGRSTSMCAVTLNGQVTLAIAGLNGLRIDFPNRPDLRWVQPGAFTHVTAFTGAGGPRLATTGPDQTLRIWDTRTRKIERTLVGHTGTVTASCAFTLGERRLLATASADHTVRIWDPAVDGFEQGEGSGHGRVTGLGAIVVGGRERVVSVVDDSVISVRDAVTGEERQTIGIIRGSANAVCAVGLWSEPVIATAGDDGFIRLWDPSSGGRRTTLISRAGRVTAMCAVTLGDAALIAAVGDDGVIRLWDPVTGRVKDSLRGGSNPILAAVMRFTSGRRPTGAFLTGTRAMCAVRHDGRTWLAATGDEHTVLLWSPKTRELRRIAADGARKATGLDAFTLNGNAQLAIVGPTPVVSLVDLAAGRIRGTLTGHTGRVEGVCSFVHAGRALLATASIDRTVRVWDAASGACEMTIPVHDPATRCAWIGDRLVIGLETGILAVRLNVQPAT